ERPFKGGKSGKGNRLEQSESQRLESLAGSFGLLALVQTTRLTGGYDFLEDFYGSLYQDRGI
ncbi:MAG: hypothetical protein IJW65_03530, partial [Clostridia bacterium]|nr:hypothetical protein [Clostridia bacterium]